VAIQKAEEEQKKEREAARDQAKNAELGKVAADIRLAVTLSHGGEIFAVLLGDCGYKIAQVTEQEAAAFKRAAELGRLATINTLPNKAHR
jgi:hypothetical protein